MIKALIIAQIIWSGPKLTPAQAAAVLKPNQQVVLSESQTRYIIINRDLVDISTAGWNWPYNSVYNQYYWRLYWLHHRYDYWYRR